MAELHQLFAGIESFLQSDAQDAAEAQVHLLCLQEAVEQVRALADVQHPAEHDYALRELVHFRGRLESAAENLHSQSRPRGWYQGERGAWTLAIDEDLLLELVELRFNDKDIGALLNCSRSTLKRRRALMGISKRQQTEMTDEELCNLVREVRLRGAGNEGQRAVEGALRGFEVKVSRARLRVAVRATDPLRDLVFRRRPVQRRVYTVPFVNPLWHIDGHHKLIRWRIVIHAGIDGKSRVVTFIHASSNNQAATVGDLFLKATEKFDWPSRVRADYGGENLEVKAHMERHRGKHDLRSKKVVGP